MEKKLYSDFENYYKDIFIDSDFNLGKFYTANIKDTGEDVYLKIYDKELLKKSKYNYLLKQIEREVELANLCKSEHILKVNRKIESENAILLEYENFDLNLFQYITEKGELSNEKEFYKKIIRELAEALKILYNKKVIHRDIKPNNIFIINKEKGSDDYNNYTIKLGNFSSAILLNENDNKQVGTIVYTPPEMFKNINYDEKVDLWSLGVTIYQLYMEYSPYGKNVNLNLIKHFLFGNNFIYPFTKNTCLNVLFKKLMTINPKERMNHKEFFEYVLDNNFMTPDWKSDNYKDIEKEIDEIRKLEKYQKILKNFGEEEEKESHNDIVILKKNVEKIVNIVSVDNLPNLMNFCKGDLNKGTKFNNIVYYDENIDNYEDEINSDADLFEDNTLGTFLLCTNLDSLNLVMMEIDKETRDDNQLKFNLIVTGSKCEKVMNYLNENNYGNVFEHACIYCMNIEKYSPLKNKYKKIYDIYNSPGEVVDYIKKFSSEDIKPFRTTKLVRLEEYEIYYYYWHKIISIFYGDLSKETFVEYIGKMKNLIDEEEKTNTLKNMDKEDLLQGFKEFDLDEDLKELDKRIIKGYTGNSYYGDINKWLMNFSISSFQEVAYFTARLMLSLNNYASKQNKYFCENRELYRGASIPFTSLLAYQRAKGKIIILSAFTSSSELLDLAKGWSNRDIPKEKYDGIFSVIFYIKNVWNKNWISNGIDINDISQYKDVEKEVLFQPFTFCLVKDVKFDLKKFTADIYLETVGKTEILEDDIKKGKKITYDENLKIIKIKN